MTILRAMDRIEVDNNIRLGCLFESIMTTVFSELKEVIVNLLALQLIRLERLKSHLSLLLTTLN